MKRQFYGILSLAAAVLLAMACNNNASTKKDGTDSVAAARTDSGSNVTDNWKLGVQLWTFRVFTMTEALQKADSCGIRYVEAFWVSA